MSPWQRRARLVIGVFAVVFAVVVAFAFRKGAPATPLPTPVRTDPGAVVESTGGRVERFKLSHEDVHVEYQKQLTYADGSSKMLGVTIVTDNRGGRSFTVTGKEGQVGQKDSSIALNGAVVLVASDGLTVRTEHATYNDADGVVRGQGPVEFERDRLSGSGIGMTYDKDNDVLQILQDAVVHVASDKAGAGKVNITSGTAGLARNDRYVLFEGGTRIERGGQITEAKTALAYLSDDQKRIESMELRESARITALKAMPGGLQSLTGRDMNLKYAADGETLEHAVILGGAVIQLAGETQASGRQIVANTIDIGLAPDGSTPTGVVGHEAVQLTLPGEPGAPSRTIRSKDMDAKGEPGRGLTRAQFTGNPQYGEHGPGVDRTASASTLDVTLKPAMSGIEDAKFARGVRFVDGKMTALSAAARYDLDKGLLELTGTEPGAVVPHVINDQIAVDAVRIDVTLAGPVMKAAGNVKSVLQPAKPGTGADGKTDTKLPSMLKQNEPVNVTGKTMNYDGAVSKATYTGGSLLWQGDTSVKGESIVIDDRTGDLGASGSVTTTTMLEDTDKDKKKTRVRSIGVSKEFQYEEALHRATYTGDAHLSGPEGDMKGDKVELYLKPSGDELDRAEAYSNVTLRDQNRKTTGSRLTYTTIDGRYLVTGTPVTILDACGRETVGRTLTYLKTADTMVVDGNEQSRTQTKGGGGDKCS
jgi:lipopolysaccharide export system protein LptA